MNDKIILTPKEKQVLKKIIKDFGNRTIKIIKIDKIKRVFIVDKEKTIEDLTRNLFHSFILEVNIPAYNDTPFSNLQNEKMYFLEDILL